MFTELENWFRKGTVLKTLLVIVASFCVGYSIANFVHDILGL